MLISISSWVSLHRLGHRTQLNAHTQMSFCSAGVTLPTVLILLGSSSTPVLGEAAVSPAVLPHSVPWQGSSSWQKLGCEALSPAPSSGLAPGMTERSVLDKMVPSEGGLLEGSVRLIPALRSEHDLMFPLLRCCSVWCSAMWQRFNILVPVSALWLASEGEEISLSFPSPASLPYAQ